MGQARIRGPREARVHQAQVAHDALSTDERKRAEWQRMSGSVRRRALNAKAMSAAMKVVAEILNQPARN